MSTRIYCDCCEKECTGKREVSFWESGAEDNPDFDLCEECYEEKLKLFQ